MCLQMDLNNNISQQLITAFNDYFFKLIDYYSAKWNVIQYDHFKHELKTIMQLPQNETKLINVFSIITNDHREQIKNHDKQYIMIIDFNNEIKKIGHDNNPQIINHITGFLDIINSIDNNEVDEFLNSLSDLTRLCEKYVSLQ